MVALVSPAPKKDHAAVKLLPGEVLDDGKNHKNGIDSLASITKEIGNPKNKLRNKFISYANIASIATDILGAVFPSLKPAGDIAYRSFLTINGISNGVYDLHRNQFMGALGNFLELPAAWLTKKAKDIYNNRISTAVYNLGYSIERALNIPKHGFKSFKDSIKLKSQTLAKLGLDLLTKPIETLRDSKRAAIGVLGSMCSGIGTILCWMGYPKAGNFFRSILSLGVEADRASIETFEQGMGNRALAMIAFTMGNIANFMAMPTLQIAFDGIGRMAAGRSNDLNEISSDFRNKPLPLPWKQPLAFAKEMLKTLIDLLLGRTPQKAMEKAEELREEVSSNENTNFATASSDPKKPNDPPPPDGGSPPPFYAPFIYRSPKSYKSNSFYYAPNKKLELKKDESKIKKEDGGLSNNDNFYDDSEPLNIKKYPLKFLLLDAPPPKSKTETKTNIHKTPKTTRNKSFTAPKRTREPLLKKEQIPKLKTITIPDPPPLLTKEERSWKLADIPTLKVIHLPKAEAAQPPVITSIHHDPVASDRQLPNNVQTVQEPKAIPSQGTHSIEPANIVFDKKQAARTDIPLPIAGRSPSSNSSQETIKAPTTSETNNAKEQSSKK